MNQGEIKERNMTKVIKTAQNLFLINGVNKTSISRIAKECDLSEMSIYRYFGNKDTLNYFVWKDSLNTFYNELMPAYQKRCETLTTGYEKFLACMEEHLKIYDTNPEWLSYTREMFSSVDTQPHRQTQEEFEFGKVDAFWEFYGKEIPLPIQHALEEGVADGSIRNDINIWEVYQLIFNVYTGQNIYRYFTGTGEDTDIFRFTINLLADFIKAR